MKKTEKPRPLCCDRVSVKSGIENAQYAAYFHKRDSTLLMMSVRSKGSGMEGSPSHQYGRLIGASSGGKVWASLDSHLEAEERFVHADLSLVSTADGEGGAQRIWVIMAFLTNGTEIIME